MNAGGDCTSPFPPYPIVLVLSLGSISEAVKQLRPLPQVIPVMPSQLSVSCAAAAPHGWDQTRLVLQYVGSLAEVTAKRV